MDKFLDWAVVAIPVIAGLAAWFIPVQKTTTKHKILLSISGLGLGGLIYLQQYETRVVHEREMGKLPTSIAQEVLKILPRPPAEIKESPSKNPSKSNGKSNPRSLGKSPNPKAAPDPKNDDVKHGIEELKSLIVGQKWGLSAEQLVLLSRRMARFASPRDRGDLITCVLGDPDSTKFAANLVAAFRSAGWNLPGSGYNQAIFSGPLQGIIFNLHSRDSNPPGLSEALATFRESAIQVSGIIDEKIPEQDFQIIVGSKP